MSRKSDAKKSAEHMIRYAKRTAEIARGKARAAMGTATRNCKFEVRGEIKHGDFKVEHAGQKRGMRSTNERPRSKWLSLLSEMLKLRYRQ